MELEWPNNAEVVHNLATLCKSGASSFSTPLLDSIPPSPKKKRTFRVDMGWVTKPITFDHEKGPSTFKNSFDQEKERVHKKQKLSTNVHDSDYVPEKKRNTNSNNLGSFKNKNKDLNNDDGPNPPPGMPEEFRTRICQLLGAGRVISEEKLVVQRKLEHSDCKGGQNRFSIPRGKLKEEFLEKTEKEIPIQRVNIIDPSFKHYKVKLSKWNPENPFYVLNGKTWRKIKVINGLLKGMIMQLWALRVDGKLWLVLVNLTPPTKEVMNQVANEGD